MLMLMLQILLVHFLLMLRPNQCKCLHCVYYVDEFRYQTNIILALADLSIPSGASQPGLELVLACWCWLRSFFPPTTPPVKCICVQKCPCCTYPA